VTTPTNSLRVSLNIIPNRAGDTIMGIRKRTVAVLFPQNSRLNNTARARPRIISIAVTIKVNLMLKRRAE